MYGKRTQREVNPIRRRAGRVVGRKGFRVGGVCVVSFGITDSVGTRSNSGSAEG